MSLKFTKSTDSEHKLKLESSLVSAMWTCGRAIGGQQATFEIVTELVGEGAPVKVTGKSVKGKKLGKVQGKMRRNHFVGALDIPEDIEPGDRVFFEVKLPKNSLDGQSEQIPAFPPIRIANMSWSATEARRGDTLTLSADIKGLPEETEVAVVIYEYDRDQVHDRIVELPAVVTSERIEISWEYQYHEDTDEIPTQEELDKYGGQYNPPEYFFTIKVEGVEYGLKQESGLLLFKDWIEIIATDRLGRPLENEKYIIHKSDGTTVEGKLNAEGIAKVDNIPPGRYRVEFPEL